MFKPPYPPPSSVPPCHPSLQPRGPVAVTVTAVVIDSRSELSVLTHRLGPFAVTVAEIIVILKPTSPTGNGKRAIEGTRCLEIPLQSATKMRTSSRTSIVPVQCVPSSVAGGTPSPAIPSLPASTSIRLMKRAVGVLVDTFHTIAVSSSPVLEEFTAAGRGGFSTVTAVAAAYKGLARWVPDQGVVEPHVDV
ncbi:hypothetical protein B0H19DRAFT_1270104 [Mycena capillaripes]|nr:hypothetical protein B0H19DRAFT_1270104 [Mycena capillaripes]